MAGVKGRSGRRPKPVREHILSGTFRPDRHGPRPAVIPTATAPAFAPRHEDAPAELLDGLGAEGRAFVLGAWAEYEEWTTPDRVLLRMAAEQCDAKAAYRAHVEADGMLLTGPRGGQYANPFLRLEVQAVKTFAALVAQIGLGGK